MVEGPLTLGLLSRLWKRRLARLELVVESRRVSIGWHADVLQEVRKIATIHEFGSRRIANRPPRRRPLSLAIGDNPNAFSDLLRDVAHQANLEAIERGGNVHAVLVRIAERGERMLKDTIQAGPPPELADSTLERKATLGYPLTPLVATGAMRDTASGVIVDS